MKQGDAHFPRSVLRRHAAVDSDVFFAAQGRLSPKEAGDKALKKNSGGGGLAAGFTYKSIRTNLVTGGNKAYLPRMLFRRLTIQKTLKATNIATPRTDQTQSTTTKLRDTHSPLSSSKIKVLIPFLSIINANQSDPAYSSTSV